MNICGRTLILVLAMAATFGSAFGCGKNDTARDVRTDAQRRQASQQAIQNNPHIPPEAKAAILQRQQSANVGGKAKK